MLCCGCTAFSKAASLPWNKQPQINSWGGGFLYLVSKFRYTDWVYLWVTAVSLTSVCCCCCHTYQVSAACVVFTDRQSSHEHVNNEVDVTHFHAGKYVSLGDEKYDFHWVQKLQMHHLIFSFFFPPQGESVKYFLDNLEKLGQSVSSSHSPLSTTSANPPPPPADW